MNRRSLNQLITLAVALLVASGFAFAQGTKSKSTSAAKSKTVTGCLQKGDEPNEFSITESGKTYGLRSSKVDLSKHLGHQVSVTGTLRPESEENEANEAKEKNEKNEQKEVGDIRVMSLKMIKDTCQ